ncbi:MAG: polysaccharide biosynthesis/export family protein [Gemmatimonadaceae bacterium]
MRLATQCYIVSLLVAGSAATSPVLQAQDSTSPLHPAQITASATPQPGDLIRMRIWREPDLSGDFRVDEQGKVILPKIGPLDVHNMSPDSLRRALNAAYAPDLRNPAIEITLLRRVQVLGAVNKPGLYDADATMTVSDAVALAGGATPEGVVGEVELRRQGAGSASTLSGQDRISATPIRSGDQLYVPQRSWLSRNAGTVTGALISAVGIVAATIITRH